jgi:hypothetical protein
MSVTVSVDNIEIEITCKCGATLDARVSKHNDEIIVDPCEDCIKDEFNKGYDKGYYAAFEEKEA